jgi:hypothetical protein
VPQPARPNGGLAIAMVALSAVYVVLCLIQIGALSHRASLANSLLANPDSVTVDQGNSADNLVSSLGLAALAVYIATFIVLAVWDRALRSYWGATGNFQALRRQSGYAVLRIVWVASFVSAIFLRGGGSPDTPQDVVNHDHEFMVYYGLRAVLGVVLIYFVLRVTRITGRALTAPQAGYGARLS